MHTTTLKEKTMALISSLFQANISAILLRSAALATVLLVQASPVRAEVLTLVCQRESGNSFTLQINYDRKTVDLLEPDGRSFFAPAAATITEGSVTWDRRFEREEVLKGYMGHYRFAGSLNRLSGEGKFTFWRNTEGREEAIIHSGSGLCRRATQKF